MFSKGLKVAIFIRDICRISIERNYNTSKTQCLIEITCEFERIKRVQ